MYGYQKGQKTSDVIYERSLHQKSEKNINANVCNKDFCPIVYILHVKNAGEKPKKGLRVKTSEANMIKVPIKPNFFMKQRFSSSF